MLAIHGFQEADTICRRGSYTQCVQDSWHHVDEPNRIAHTRAGGHFPPCPSRQADHERNPKNALVEEDPVVLLAVLAERLAVVRDDDEQRVVKQPASLEGAEQPVDLCLGERNFADIRIGMT